MTAPPILTIAVGAIFVGLLMAALVLRVIERLRPQWLRPERGETDLTEDELAAMWDAGEPADIERHQPE